MSHFTTSITTHRVESALANMDFTTCVTGSSVLLGDRLLPLILGSTKPFGVSPFGSRLSYSDFLFPMLVCLVLPVCFIQHSSYLHSSLAHLLEITSECPVIINLMLPFSPYSKWSIFISSIAIWFEEKRLSSLNFVAYSITTHVPLLQAHKFSFLCSLSILEVIFCIHQLL